MKLPEKIMWVFVILLFLADVFCAVMYAMTGDLDAGSGMFLISSFLLFVFAPFYACYGRIP